LETPLENVLWGSSFGDTPLGGGPLLGSIAHILISFGNVHLNYTIEKTKKKEKKFDLEILRFLNGNYYDF